MVKVGKKKSFERSLLSGSMLHDQGKQCRRCWIHHRLVSAPDITTETCVLGQAQVASLAPAEAVPLLLYQEKWFPAPAQG